MRFERSSSALAVVPKMSLNASITENSVLAKVCCVATDVTIWEVAAAFADVQSKHRAKLQERLRYQQPIVGRARSDRA
ncbi:MAG: hypothetical protein CMQ44_02040 [Gammaproteobacteria bacterium]|nr:hypothetical protein [Gammaproteobacteria bacterium]